MLTIILSLFSSARQAFQTRAALQAEILALQHWLLVLQSSSRHHRLRLSRADRFLWVWPDSPSDYPEELIEEAEARSRMSTFQHRELLLEHEILQYEVPPATEKANQGTDPEEKQIEHW
jgi:hypothetical protein